MKTKIFALVFAGALAMSMVGSALAAPPTVGTSPAAPNAQCGTAASSGAFNFQNLVYGPNQSAWGQAGGANGPKTGLANSAICGNNPGN